MTRQHPAQSEQGTRRSGPPANAPERLGLPALTEGAGPPRVSGAPAPDGALDGLDVFGDATPRQPGHALANAPRTTPGVTNRASAPAAASSAPRLTTPLPAATGVPVAGQSAPPRPRTLTQQLRSIQPPDVARQAIDELGILARELDALPAQLEASGLAPIHQRNYLQTTQLYLGLAHRAWDAVAEERLEQSGAEGAYRESAIEIARQMMRLQQESQVAAGNDQFPLPQRHPLFWRRRTRFAHAGLASWQNTISSPADPTRMGLGLFYLRGYIGLAAASGFELFLMGCLTISLAGSSLLLLLGLLTLLAPAIANGQPTESVGFATGAIAVSLVWMLALYLTSAGRAPLRLLLGATNYAPTHTVRNGRHGSRLLGALFRGWTALVLLASLLGTLAALALSGDQARLYIMARHPAQPLQWVGVVGDALVRVGAPTAAVVYSALVLLALPLLLISALRLMVELASNPTWVPAARRALLAPTMTIVAFLTGAVLVGALYAARAAGLHQALLLEVDGLLPTHYLLSWRAVAVFVALAAPYFLLVEGPFRLGIRAWQRIWLNDLLTRRANLESHLRRLSATDAQTGVQNTSEENLRAMQYDLVLMQFLRNKIEEAQQVARAPFGIKRVVALIVLFLLLALLIDSIGPTLAPLLTSI